jgi:ABC-type Zn uptake system ZnuABC Zn-binding protein ZnuA
MKNSIIKSIKHLIQVTSLAAFLVASQAAQAALNIFACEPEWGALAKELGGEKVTVFTATNAMQDVHHIEAKPSLVAKLRQADLVVCTGSELEIGWLPVLLRQSGNTRVQENKPGNFEAAHYVRMLDIPSRLDRADGDVHPGGNPHIQTDPRNIGKVGDALAQRLGESVAQIGEVVAVGFTCRHGDMIKKEGVAKATKKPYAGYVCSAPKEDQCDAKWAKLTAAGTWYWPDDSELGKGGE